MKFVQAVSGFFGRQLAMTRRLSDRRGLADNVRIQIFGGPSSSLSLIPKFRANIGENLISCGTISHKHVS